MKIWFFLLTLATFIYANECCSAQEIEAACANELPQIQESIHVTNSDDLKMAMQALKRGQFDVAFSLFQTLAEQGNFLAQQNLGVMYNNGFGIAKNTKLASYWFEKAQHNIQESNTFCSKKRLQDKQFIMNRVCMN